VLLQVLDDGRLTDGQGRTVDFRNTVIILTSNLGAEYFAAQPEGEDSTAVRRQVMSMVRTHFRPEFLNRLDEIILFHRLTREQMDAIVDIQIGHLMTLLEDRKIALRLDPKAKTWLASAGFDPVYGARPLKRVIQRHLQDPLANLILEGKISNSETIDVSASKRGLIINGKEFVSEGDNLGTLDETGPSRAVH
ncbi:MAG: AAA family ATPase, partial [Proteobacteria bacterium]|nr:AAA family ATPase [Pseudomonadota bacterium]